MQSLQQQYFSKGICFGCGPLNQKGLQINSYPEGDKVVCDWKPQPQHQAFHGVLNGGIIGTLLDCHCNWTGAYYLMKQYGMDTAPCTVTAEYSIQLLRPTPVDKTLHLEAWVVDLQKDRVTVEGQLMIGNKVYDKCRGVFVVVKEGHPAFHRW